MFYVKCTLFNVQCARCNFHLWKIPLPQAAIDDIEDFAPKPPINELAPKFRNRGLRLLMIFSYGRGSQLYLIRFAFRIFRVCGELILGAKHSWWIGARDDHEKFLIDFSYASQVITYIYTFLIVIDLGPTNNHLILARIVGGVLFIGAGSLFIYFSIVFSSLPPPPQSLKCLQEIWNVRL